MDFRRREAQTMLNVENEVNKKIEFLMLQQNHMEEIKSSISDLQAQLKAMVDEQVELEKEIEEAKGKRKRLVDNWDASVKEKKQKNE